MSRLPSPTRSGARHQWWIAVATVAVLLATAAPAQAAPFAYIVDDNQMVSQYEVVAGGLLAPMHPATVPTGGDAIGVAVGPGGESVYVTAYQGVWQYDIGPGGELSPKSPATVPTGEGAGGVTVSPDGQSVYAINGRTGASPNMTSAPRESFRRRARPLRPCGTGRGRWR